MDYGLYQRRSSRNGDDCIDDVMCKGNVNGSFLCQQNRTRFLFGSCNRVNIRRNASGNLRQTKNTDTMFD